MKRKIMFRLLACITAFVMVLGLGSISIYLPYYGGHSSGHYTAVSEVDRTTGKVRLSDCNWRNEYFGVHVESIEKVYQSIAAESGRYLIYMSY